MNRSEPAAERVPKSQSEPKVQESTVTRERAVISESTGQAERPEMTPVQSSNIQAVGHDGTALWVQFKNGTTYKYGDCGAAHHQGLLEAKSPGRYLLDRIRFAHKAERVE